MIFGSPHAVCRAAFVATCYVLGSAPLVWPSDLIVSGAGGLLRLDGDSGELIEIVATEPGFTSIRTGPGGDLFALKTTTGTIHRFDGSTLNYIGLFTSISELEGAAGFTFDASGRLVSGRGTLIHVFDENAEGVERTINLHSMGMRVIAAVATGADGGVYVSDRNTGRIFRVDLGAGGNPVTLLPDRFGVPHGLAFNAEGGLLVADSGTISALVRLTGDVRTLGGFFIGDLPVEHQFQQPFDVATGADGEVVVLDREAKKLLRFDRSLAFVDLMGEESSRVGQQPRSIVFSARPRSEEGFEEWQQEHFSESELADESISGLQADPAGDGFANLLRYGLGVGPWSPVRDHLPAQWIETIGGEDFLFFTYTRIRGRSDLEVRAEVSNDLISWEYSPERLEVVQVENLGGVERVTIRDALPIGGAARHFIRVRVIYDAQ